MVLDNSHEDYEECLDECVIQRDICELASKSKDQCEAETERCHLECDIKYGA